MDSLQADLELVATLAADPEHQGTDGTRQEVLKAVDIGPDQREILRVLLSKQIPKGPVARR
jgi:hypothetical protein